MTKITPQKQKAILEALEAGGTRQGVADQLGISKSAVNRVAKAAGLTKRTKVDRSTGPDQVVQDDRKPGQHWTEKDKAEALSVYLDTASVIKTSKVTGIPARTLYRWLDDNPRWRDAASHASRVCARMLEDRADHIQLNLIRMAEGQDGKDAAAAMRGIETLHKTLSFIGGGPSERTETNLTSEEWREADPNDLPL